ncbi:MAG: type II toxin-antitoxin system Phd/YefM family antitoxin [Polyangiaceae bacterium]|nr:type II toxin-antitoxin system Phd/YefM family antitoxin [Polyangiaceae bacterium]
MKSIAAGQFKATCLALIDEVAKTGEPIVVTKHGKPLARLVAVEAEEPRRSIFGSCKDMILYLAPTERLLSTGAVWDAVERSEKKSRQRARLRARDAGR